MADPVFGIAFRAVEEETRPIIQADLSTIGIIGPATGADADVYPLNTPVRVYSNEVSKVTAIGEDGYLADAIRGINDQLGEMQFAARIVVVRTAPGVSVDPAIKAQQTISNIMGSSTLGTGLWAFLKAPHLLGVTPRLIIAPGYTGQMANGVNVITQDVDGSNYVPDQSYALTFATGGPDAVQATAHAIGQNDGTLGDAILDTPGAWYTGAPTVEAPSAGKRVTVAAVAVGGTGYAVADTIVLANGVELTVATLTGSAVATVSIETPGAVATGAANPTNPQAQVSTSGGGTGATFNLTWAAWPAATYTATVAVGANPIVSALNPVLNQLMGHAVVESSGQSQENDDDWRETINSKRIIPISGGCRVMDPVSGTVLIRPLASRVVGIGVRRDHEKGGMPFHSWANQAVQGIIGPARDIPFALTDGANEAQDLLRNNIGVLVRGELGNEFAIASGGFIFIGTDNAGEDELWRFYNQTRGRDWILLTALRALRYYLGKYNITPHTVAVLMRALRIILRDAKADGNLIGYNIGFNPAANSADEIRLGHLTLSFAAEEPAVLRKLVIEHGRFRQALDIMIADLAAQLDLVA